MGNRISLAYTDCCKFEANNCLPIPWLAFFAPEDLCIEIQHEGDKEYQTVHYRTDRTFALQHAERIILLLKGHTPAWRFLRPIETLRDELNACSSEIVELDATAFWAIDESVQRKISNAIQAFHKTLNAFIGVAENDFCLLDALVREYTLFESPPSVEEMNAEERMWTLIGTYWGDSEKEKLFSPAYFDSAYWGEGL